MSGTWDRSGFILNEWQLAYGIKVHTSKDVNSQVQLVKNAELNLEEIKDYCKVTNVESNWLTVECKNKIKGYIYIEDVMEVFK